LLAAKANTITVIDHHKTALDELDGAIVPDNVTLRIDMSKSGVGLTWAFFFGDAVMPKLYQYVQDRDLWKFELPQSKEVNAVVSATENTMEAFASLRDSLERPNGVGGAIAAGVAIIAMTKKQAEAHLKRARRAVSTAGVPYMYCNVSSFTSEVGHHILEQVPEVEFVVMYFEDNRTGTRVYSLRSRTGGYKIHQIAKEFGGGGHPHAAGYTTSDDSALRLP
jgi:oligoribonuclease NrnB/cAMP/cGMP phosphodiesterase (DHH superfamily)